MCSIQRHNHNRTFVQSCFIKDYLSELSEDEVIVRFVFRVTIYGDVRVSAYDKIALLLQRNRATRYVS